MTRMNCLSVACARRSHKFQWACHGKHRTRVNVVEVVVRSTLYAGLRAASFEIRGAFPTPWNAWNWKCWPKCFAFWTWNSLVFVLFKLAWWRNAQFNTKSRTLPQLSSFHQYLSTIFANSLRRRATCCGPFHDLHHIAFFICTFLCCNSCFSAWNFVYVNSFLKSHPMKIQPIRCPASCTHDEASSEMCWTMPVSRMPWLNWHRLAMARTHSLTHGGTHTALG